MVGESPSRGIIVSFDELIFRLVPYFIEILLLLLLLLLSWSKLEAMNIHS